MESYWDKMQKTGSFVEESQHNADLRQRVEEEIMSRKKADIRDVIKKSRSLQPSKLHRDTIRKRRTSIKTNNLYIKIGSNY